MDSNANSALYRIELRRRYRNWVLAAQVAMLVFFVDQILKTWTASTIVENGAISALGIDSFSLVHRPGGAPWAPWRIALPTVFLILLAGLNVARVRRAYLSDLLPLAGIAAAAASTQLTLLLRGRPLHSLEWIVFRHSIEFAFADLVLWGAGAGWLFVLAREVWRGPVRRWEAQSTAR